HGIRSTSTTPSTPSEPDVIPYGTPTVASGYSASTCGGGGSPGRIRPILFALNSVNQRAPSGPVTMLNGPLSGVGMKYSVRAPEVVMRAMRPESNSAIQSAPSGPAVRPKLRVVLGIGNSVTAPAVLMRPI